SDLFSKYRLSDALMVVYKIFWDEFSSWYLEMVKPAYINGEAQPIDCTTYKATLRFFDVLLKMLHPFMPFITEELWQALEERQPGDSIMRESLNLETPNTDELIMLKNVEDIKLVVSGVRTVRAQKNIAPKEKLTLQVVGANLYGNYGAAVMKMANLEAINEVNEKAPSAQSFLVGTREYAVPLGNLIDTEAEIKKAKAEIERLTGFMAGIQKKLGNERFVQNAPAQVVEMERKKLADAESKIAALQESIRNLGA
ncbi:MAG: class I tRNA ligase family protein, partial [Bacteroidaceae bacterium]|nr:class I tRNA ligase family protein [Bacteroidaceae bacterium]